MSINPMELTQADVGRWVWYKPPTGYGPLERGRIKSWNDKNIFAVYKCDGQWHRFQEFTAEGANANDLTFIEHQAHCRAALDFMCSCVPPGVKKIADDFDDET